MSRSLKDCDLFIVKMKKVAKLELVKYFLTFQRFSEKAISPCCYTTLDKLFGTKMVYYKVRVSSKKENK